MMEISVYIYTNVYSPLAVYGCMEHWQKQADIYGVLAIMCDLA